MAHSGVHNHFMNEQHVTCRSNCFWAGLSPDPVMEQVLMHNLKTSGGVTRSRGMSERQWTTWFLSVPVTIEVNRAMQNFTGTKCQNK